MGARATRHFGDLIHAVCTINEVNVPTMVRRGSLAHSDHQDSQAMAQALGTPADRFGPFWSTGSEPGIYVIIRAHQQTVQAIRAERDGLPVGLTAALQDMQAVDRGDAVRDAARHDLQDMFLDATANDDDVGVQTYSRTRFGPGGPLGPEAGVELTQMGYAFCPEALEQTIRYAVTRTGLPVIVTENGIGTDDDTRRIEYRRRAVTGVVNCLRDGLDVRGYFAWSAFDNSEWHLGYAEAFVIVAVNRDTQERVVKPSARYLGRIAESNAFDG